MNERRQIRIPNKRFLTTGDVAAALGWSEDTIRRRIMTLTEYLDAVRVDPSLKFERIPSLRGSDSKYGHHQIPRDWLVELAAASELRVEDEPMGV
ncbi:MAG: hypothetical protein AB7T06_29225 [Kofleriaceae bacterium]